MIKQILLTVVVLLLVGKESYSQKNRNKTDAVKLEQSNFEFQPGKVEFIEHKGGNQ